MRIPARQLRRDRSVNPQRFDIAGAVGRLLIRVTVGARRTVCYGVTGLNTAQYLVRETLNDGTPVTIRAVRPDDKERILTAFLALEPQSIYARFFYAKTELSEQELRQLTEIDYVSAVVL